MRDGEYNPLIEYLNTAGHVALITYRILYRNLHNVITKNNGNRFKLL